MGLSFRTISAAFAALTLVLSIAVPASAATFLRSIDTPYAGGYGIQRISGKIAVGDGVAYVSDYRHDSIYVANLKTNTIVDTWTTPVGYAPYGLAVDPGTGNVFVALGADDFVGDTRVQVYSPSGVPVTSWGGVGSLDGQFHEATGITFALGSVWVADKSRIQRFSPSGVHQSTLNESGNYDHAVAVDAAGNTYSTINGWITKYDALGTRVPQWGASIKTPLAEDVEVGPDGNVYVLHWSTVEVFDPAGDLVTSIDDTGMRPDQLEIPSGIAVGADNLAYVFDAGRIKVFDMKPPAPEEPKTPTETPTTPTNPAPAPPAPLPAAKLVLGKLKLAKATGTATLPVTVSGKGTLTLSGTGVARRTVAFTNAPTAKLKIAASGKAAKALKRTGRVTLKLTLVFKPASGQPVTSHLIVTLRRS
jgi:DNA-binding beta-propeller fold protein YncE